MFRPDEKRSITSIHTSLLAKIEEGAVIGGELAELYGSNFVELVEDLVANDYPVWKEAADWEDMVVSVYYYEAPGQESALCPVCNSKTRTMGPFCSVECESRFINSAMSDWKRRKAERRAGAPSLARKPEPVKITAVEPIAQKPVRGSMPLRNIIPAATIIHLSKKAALNKMLNQSERNSLSYIGGRIYRNEMTTETEKNAVESILEKSIQAGIATAPCPNGDCERCKGLVEILIAHGILRKSKNP